MKRIVSFLGIAFLAAAFIFIMPAPAAHADNYTVTKCDNDTELRTALGTMQGSGGGVLSFNCGTKTILLTGGPLPTITTSTYIDGGNKITLSGGGATWLFYVVSGASLNLYNLTITKGYSSGDGGAIYNEGSLSIETSKFLANETSPGGSGGAIYSQGSLYINASEFANNKAGNGGALYLKWSASNSQVVGSKLHHNETRNTTDGWGGAMLIFDGAQVSIRGSTLNDNKAIDGGAVYVTNNSSVTIDQSMLNYNQATGGHGGAILNYYKTTLTNSTLAGNEAATAGGAIDHNYSYLLSLTNVTISNNGAMFGGGISSTKAKGTLTNVTIVGNSATNAGGGIDNGSYDGEGLDLLNTIIAYSPSGGNCHDTNAKTINSLGFNISSDNTCTEFFDQAGDRNETDPELGDLAGNGGGTTTRKPGLNSPAVDGGTISGCPATDQRGYSRPQGASCDIGAVELTPTETCNIKPPNPSLKKPTNGATLTKTSVKLKWQPSNCAEKYKITVRRDNPNGPKVTGGKTTELKFKLTGLTKVHTYYWFVKACNPPFKCGKSPTFSFHLQ